VINAPQSKPSTCRPAAQIVDELDELVHIALSPSVRRRDPGAQSTIIVCASRSKVPFAEPSSAFDDHQPMAILGQRTADVGELDLLAFALPTPDQVS
jgi:hypothetical protein